MAIEIERRFLIKNDGWKEFITKQTFIEQGYLSYKLEDWIIRIRYNGKNFSKRYRLMLEKIYYKVFEFIVLGLMLALFGLYVIYLFIEMIILSFVDVFRSICRK